MRPFNESYRTVRFFFGAVCYSIQGGSNFWVCGWNHKVKAIEQYVSVVQSVILYKVVLSFEPVDEIIKCDHSNKSYRTVRFCGAVCYSIESGSNFWVCAWNHKVKAIEQYVSVVQSVILYKVVLTFEPVDEIIKCVHSNESYRAVRFCGAVYSIQGGSNFWVCGWNHKTTSIQMNAIEQYVFVVQFVILHKTVVRAFESVFN